MPYTAGSYAAPSNSWNPAVAGSAINATDWAALLADLTTALSTCVLKDGTQTMTASLPMGGFKVTGLAAGSTNGDALRYEQVNGVVTTVGDLLQATGSAAFTRVPFGNLGDVLTGAGSGVAVGASATPSPINLALSATASGNVLTVAIKGRDGNDPSSTDQVLIPFRNATAGTGDYTWRALTGANSIATTAGGTFGIANSVAFRLWIVAFDDAGTVRLGLINCLTTVAGVGTGRDVTAIFPLGQFPVASSTQIGAGSTSAGVFYTAGAAVTSKAYVVLGYITYESGLATMGTFSGNPSRLHLQTKGDPLPGQVIQNARNDTGAVATGTTVFPITDAVQTNGAGDQYMSQAITPNSAANVVDIDIIGHFSSSAGGPMSMGLFQDATSNVIATSVSRLVGTVSVLQLKLRKRILAATTSATTLKIRAGNNGAGTTTFNGESATRIDGGTLNSFMEAQEIVA